MKRLPPLFPFFLAALLLVASAASARVDKSLAGGSASTPLQMGTAKWAEVELGSESQTLTFPVLASKTLLDADFAPDFAGIAVCALVSSGERKESPETSPLGHPPEDPIVLERP